MRSQCEEKTVAALAVSRLLALMVDAPAFAYQALCEEEAGTYGVCAHHVLPLAQAGELGAGGHKPGEHHGYAGLCGVQSGT